MLRSVGRKKKIPHKKITLATEKPVLLKGNFLQPCLTFSSIIAGVPAPLI
jgi:hypothetical protein